LLLGNEVLTLSPSIASVYPFLVGPKQVAIPVLTPDRVNKRQNGRRFKEDNDPMFTLRPRLVLLLGNEVLTLSPSIASVYPFLVASLIAIPCLSWLQVAQTLQAGEVNQGVVVNPLKDKTDYGWHFEQAVYELCRIVHL
jgi:DNA (cytosine-5)-methyltransferase 1